METKAFKTFDEQIEILKSRNCIIKNEKDAKKILSLVNYYRFTSLLIPYKIDENNYKENTIFEDIYKIYLFDSELRGILRGAIEKVEISIKTKIAYYFSEEYGPIGYLEKENYSKSEYFDELKEKMDDVINRNSNNLIIKHHKDHYGGKFPLWVIIDFFSFSTISKMYSQIDIKIRKKVANSICVKEALLNSWLYCLSVLRNICAHCGRVYNIKMASLPLTPKAYEIDNGKLGKDLFSLIFVLKELLIHLGFWKEIYEQIKKIITKYEKFIDLDLIGFPAEWKSLLG